MSAVLLPGGAVRAQRAPAKAIRRKDPKLAGVVLVAVILLELAARFMPEAMLLHPLQQATWFKQATGYTMLALMSFAMAFGWLRRLPALAHRQAGLNQLHQVSGLLLLLLLGSHLGHTPSGFLLWVFHAMAVATGAGALRALLGPRIGARGSMALLLTHIGLSCLVLASAVVHLYLVYAYTA